MAVTFDSLSPGSSGKTSTGNSNTTLTTTWSHTCSGTNRALIVGATFDVGDYTTYTLSATYNGAAMTLLGAINSDHLEGKVNGFVMLFGMAAPDAGANTVSLSITGSSSSNTVTSGSISFAGVDQTTPFPHIVTNSGTTTTAPSAVVTSATGNMVVDVACYGSSFTTSTQTLQWEDNVNGNSGAGNGASSTASGATSVTMGYASSSDWWGIVAADVLASTGGGSANTAPVAWLRAS